MKTPISFFTEIVKISKICMKAHLCPWNSPCRVLELVVILFPRESSQGSPALQVDSLQPELPGKPCIEAQIPQRAKAIMRKNEAEASCFLISNYTTKLYCN